MYMKYTIYITYMLVVLYTNHAIDTDKRTDRTAIL